MMGESSRSLSLMEESVAIKRKVLPPDDLELSTSLSRYVSYPQQRLGGRPWHWRLYDDDYLRLGDDVFTLLGYLTAWPLPTGPMERPPVLSLFLKKH